MQFDVVGLRLIAADFVGFHLISLVYVWIHLFPFHFVGFHMMQSNFVGFRSIALVSVWRQAVQKPNEHKCNRTKSDDEC